MGQHQELPFKGQLQPAVPRGTGAAMTLKPRPPARMPGLSGLNRRILITGGAGFIRSHLCERLVAQNNDVLCVDNFFTGSRNNIAHLIGDTRFETLRHDVTFPL
jgi:hypothetical protein